MNTKLRNALVMGAGLTAIAAVTFAGAGQSAESRLTVSVLSSRPDMVSGGDALIEVSAPAGTTAVAVTAAGKEVSGLTAGPNSNTWRGVVSGLALGKSDIVARAGGKSAKVTVTNYPITGPILSGPHMKPYECKTEASGLGKALDADCSVATRTDYFYRSTDGSATLKPWPTGARPTDIRTTTTIDGKTVPYIVKIESGTINRTIYRIGMLDDPATPAKQDGWNGRFAVSFGGGSGTNYNQGSNSVQNGYSDLYLSRGFGYMVATELVNGLHGNAVLQGETLAMLKEHFIEEYGPPKWTVGTGGSGGAIQQLLLTEIFPGLLDGLQPSLSFPDSSMHTADCGILQNYFESRPEWTPDKQAAVTGFTPGTCTAWKNSFVNVSKANYKPGCGLTDLSLTYDAVTNPRGARCASQEMRINIYGKDPKTGFAYKGIDNVGLQYGLKGLNDGKLTVDEFLDINEKVGGYDLDGSFVAQRSVADMPAIRAMYKSGLMNSGGGGLGNVPIIHSRTYNDARGDIHDRHRDLTIRARLDRANGRHDNEVIWVYGAEAAAAAPAASAGRGGAAAGRGAAGRGGAAAPAAGAAGRGGAAAPAAPAGPNVAALSLDAMTRWLDAMIADPGPLNTDKVVRHKPAEATDAYWNASGVKVAETATFEGDTGYNRTYPMHWEPRLVAGAPLTNDIIKCQLKPIRMADYKASFTAEQAARLKRIFPAGVCDFSKRGVGQVKFGGTWQRY